jgi:hypothetical protein
MNIAFFGQMDINHYYLLLGGIVILTLSLIRYQIKRRRKEVIRNAEKKKAAQLAAEKEQRRQKQHGEPVKTQPEYKERFPVKNPVIDTFTGSAPPRQILQWELEIDELGRRMVGQLDSKMSALQTMILESNRIANRMEILLEALEKYKHLYEPGALAPAAETAETGVNTPGSLEVKPLVLNDLEAELHQLEKEIKQSFAEEPQSVSILRESATLSQQSSQQGSPPPTGSHFDSLFSEQNKTFKPNGASLELKKQIEMLADYGNDARQIAKDLNIPIGEVDLILSLRE